jgi:hypothetical protein
MRLVSLAVAAALTLSVAPQAHAFEFSKTVGNWIGLGKGDDRVDPDAKAVTWEDLTPPLTPEQKAAAAELNIRIDTMTDAQIERALDLIGQNGGEVIEELDGQKITIEGYLVPLDFEATEAKAFVLVPFIGACVHVPPPPPNQIIFVEYDEGVPMKALEDNMWTPFRIAGTLRAAAARTQLADVGYQMEASSVSVLDL